MTKNNPQRCIYVIGFAGNPKWTCLKTIKRCMKRCKDPFDSSCTKYDTSKSGGSQK